MLKGPLSGYSAWGVTASSAQRNKAVLQCPEISPQLLKILHRCQYPVLLGVLLGLLPTVASHIDLPVPDLGMEGVLRLTQLYTYQAHALPLDPSLQRYLFVFRVTLGGAWGSMQSNSDVPQPFKLSH